MRTSDDIMKLLFSKNNTKKKKKKNRKGIKNFQRFVPNEECNRGTYYAKNDANGKPLGKNILIPRQYLLHL